MRLVERFQYLLERQKNADFTKGATEKRLDNQRKRKIVVPTTEEINNLLNIINNEIHKYYQILSTNYDLQAWKKLSQYILRYTIFCRKRPGDIERLEVIEFQRGNVLDNEFMNTLEKNDKSLANILARCVTRGKLNQAASILFSREHMRGMSLVLKYREKAGVARENKYSFADPGTKRYPYWRAAEELKSFCRVHNLDSDKLTATKCRYYLASSTARLDNGHQNAIDSIQPVAEVTKELTPAWMDKNEQTDDCHGKKNKKLKNSVKMK
ncbi:hypothetical protein JTB14_025722 [Gonioctena quinquepunctata]|nr:hypothetical protein JTB14_025722 [Gonioctena quinquepunctata]